MGIIPNPSPEYGNYCSVCWPFDETPGTIKVFFSGIESAQLAGPGGAYKYNGYYDLTRNPANPCHWDHGDTDPIKIILRLGYPSSWIRMSLRTGGGIFTSWDFPACTFWFENQNVWANKIGWKGSCYVATPLKLKSLIEQVTPMIDPDPRMECYPMEDENIAVRYAGKRDATNIMIKFDTNA